MISTAAEKLFENKIKKYLTDHGWWYVKFFANAYTKSGVPDVLSTVNGYFLAIEVKAPNGKPSELQKYNVNLINGSGAFAVIVKPDQWSDLKELIEQLAHDRLHEARLTVIKMNAQWDM